MEERSIEHAFQTDLLEHFERQDDAIFRSVEVGDRVRADVAVAGGRIARNQAIWKRSNTPYSGYSGVLGVAGRRGSTSPTARSPHQMVAKQ